MKTIFLKNKLGVYKKHSYDNLSDLKEELSELGIVIGSNVIIEQGAIVERGVTIEPGVRIGPYVIIEHDVTLEHYVTIGPDATIGPGVIIERGVTIGPGVIIEPGVRIESDLEEYYYRVHNNTCSTVCKTKTKYIFIGSLECKDCENCVSAGKDESGRGWVECSNLKKAL